MTTEKPSLRFQTQDGRFGVSIPAPSTRKLLRICEEACGLETGGILIGCYSDDLSVALVNRVTGPPSDSKHFFSRFMRGVKGLQELLDSYWSHPNKQFYLGEWHYHPMADPHPSGEDLKQMRKIASDKCYSCPEPVLLIVAKQETGHWLFSVTVHTSDGKILEMSGDLQA